MFDILTVENSGYHIPRYFRRPRLACNNLFIFIQYVIGHTKTISTRHKLAPNRIIDAVTLKSGQKAIRIQNYIIHNQC